MGNRVINVRKLVSLDITLHGPKFILIEFGVGTPVILAVGIWLIEDGPFLLGLYLLLTGINYLPLLAYAIITSRRGTARQDIQEDLARDRHYVRKYSTQQLLIFVPLTILVLAILQRNGSSSESRKPINH